MNFVLFLLIVSQAVLGDVFWRYDEATGCITGRESINYEVNCPNGYFVVERIGCQGCTQNGISCSNLKTELDLTPRMSDSTRGNSRGNPKWYARGDMPHTHTPFHNVNKGIFGVKDPHNPFSATRGKADGAAGGNLEGVPTIAPLLVGCSVKDDIEHNSNRNTIKTVVTKTATVAGCLGGASAGAAIGTALFPGVGTLIGGLFGSIIGGGATRVGSEVASEVVLDAVKYDIDDMTCKKCGKRFEYRRYKEMNNDFCPECRRNC